MITTFTILGERCSGTNFLEQTILQNFNIELTWDYGWKHFFGFNEYNCCDNVLFIAIVRDPYKWLNSLYKNPSHLANHLRENPIAFLTSEFWSYFDNENEKDVYGKEILVDRHIYTKCRYKNIFECRKIKCQFLLDDMKNNVKNYIIIKYEDLRDEYEKTLDDLKNKFNLIPKNNNYVHIPRHTGLDLNFIIDNNEILDRNIISQNIDHEIENRLGYV